MEVPTCQREEENIKSDIKFIDQKDKFYSTFRQFALNQKNVKIGFLNFLNLCHSNSLRWNIKTIVFVFLFTYLIWCGKILGSIDPDILCEKKLLGVLIL